MSDLILNGAFPATLASWTTGFGGSPAATWIGTKGYVSPGACQTTPGGAACTTYQVVTTPIGDPQIWRLGYAVYNNVKGAILDVDIWDFPPSAPIYHRAIGVGEYEPGVWYAQSTDMLFPANTALRVEFQATGAVGSWIFDDVSFVNVSLPTTNTRSGLIWELMKRRRDWGAFKHGEARYQQAVNRAIGECPWPLWRVDEDITIVSVADTTRYSLAALTAITNERQVRRVWLHDGETPGQYNLIGRWTIEQDWAGIPLIRTLYLVLDEAPATVGTIIKIEYARSHDALGDDVAIPVLDAEWILAKAMTLLLLEADPSLEDPAQLERDLSYWDKQRAMREALIVPRRPAGKVRTYKW